MVRVYGHALSGNAYKVKLALSLLDIKHQWIDVDLFSGEHKTPEFLQKNPVGKVPVLELPNGECLTESNAILLYLAEETCLMPQGKLLRARVLQWLFFEQYSHEPNIAGARFITQFCSESDKLDGELRTKQIAGYHALEVLEGHLRDQDFLVGDTLSVADIALYAYTHIAEEGGFNLERFPGLCRWIDRVSRFGKHVAMLEAA